jgi:spore coat polysaccharide biosynthesis protein SpsF
VALGRVAFESRSEGCDVVYFDDFALPRGVAPELVRTNAFFELRRKELSAEEREHVTLGLYKRAPERALALPVPAHFRHPELRLTLDYPDDYRLLVRLFEQDPSLTAERAVERLLREPGLRALNQHCQTAVPA